VGAEVDWFCSRTKKQGHRILVDTSLAKVILKIDDEIDSHAWYQTINKAIENHKEWAQNNRFEKPQGNLSTRLVNTRNKTTTSIVEQRQQLAKARLSQSAEHLPCSPISSISDPTHVIKSSPEDILKQLSSYSKASSATTQTKRETKSQNSKLGRKGISKSFRKMASGLQLKSRKPEEDDDDDEVQVRKKTNQLDVKTVSAKRRSINREPSRRSVYLSRFLKKRPTYEEIKAQGLIKDNSVFGCNLQYQRIVHGKTLQVPEFVWKCIEKLESDPVNLATEEYIGYQAMRQEYRN